MIVWYDRTMYSKISLEKILTVPQQVSFFVLTCAPNPHIARAKLVLLDPDRASVVAQGP